MNDLDFFTAMRLLEEMTGTFWRPLTKHLFFVAQDTSQKRKEYGVSVVRTILLPASATPDQLTEMLRMVREVTGITRSDLDTRSRTLTLRASPQALAVASSLIEDLEKPVGELVLEIEVLEVDRTYARHAGNSATPDSADLLTQQSGSGSGGDGVAGIDRGSDAGVRPAEFAFGVDDDANRDPAQLRKHRRGFADPAASCVWRRGDDFSVYPAGGNGEFSGTCCRW